MLVCKRQKGNKCWHGAQPGLLVTVPAALNTCMQHQLQGDGYGTSSP